MIGGITIGKEEFVLQGVPGHVFVNGSPSPFRTGVNLPIVETIEEPEDGGFLTYYRGQKYPRKGILTPDALNDVGYIKRLVRDTAHLSKSFGIFIFPILLVPKLRRWFLWRLAEWFAGISDLTLSRWYIVPSKCTKVVRSVYQACGIAFSQSKFTDRQRWLVDRIVMAFGLVLEFDDTYRYRFQDIIALLDKGSFREDPARELKRLYGILNDRELSGGIDGDTRQKAGMKSRLDSMFLALRALLFLFPDWRLKAIDIVDNLDLEYASLDDGDFYHASIFNDYMHRGMTVDEKLAWRRKQDEGNEKVEMLVSEKANGTPA